jgi:ribosomal protein L11 methyltransferase
MKTYKEFTIRTIPFLPEIVTGILWELNIAGLTEEDDLIKVFSIGRDLTKDIFNKQLTKLLNENLIESFTVEENQYENKNWNEEWEQSLTPIKVTDKIVIRPSLKEYTAEQNEIVITIDPKMSFGTGEHQTTKLMLQLIEKYIKKGMKVLDVGSGTAVLAIASVKLGAAKAVAVDNDELCFNNGNENIKLNEVEDRIEVRTGDIKDVNEFNFDMILANIQKNVLIEIADEISRRIKQKGIVILSGLLSGDEAAIEDIYQSSFKIMDIKQMDEWIALVYIKK